MNSQDRPTPPEQAEALRLIRRGGSESTLQISRRARDRAKELGYDFDDVCNQLATGTFLTCWIEPHDTVRDKFVLIGKLQCWAPGTKPPDILYVKIVLSRQPRIISWKLDGSPA